VADAKLEKTGSSNYTFTDRYGDTLKIEPADLAFTGTAGAVYLDIGDGNDVELPKELVQDFVNAVLDASTPDCKHCNGSGKAAT